MNASKPLQLNKAAIAGIAGSILPLVFWSAVAFQLIFRNNFLMDHLFTPIDQCSSFLSILLLVIVPAIALLINFFNVFSFRFEKQGSELQFTLIMHTRIIHIMVVLFTAFNILLIVGYAFMENFILIPRH